MTEKLERSRKEEFCWFCNDTVKKCEHQKDVEKRKMNRFLNWVNYGGNEKTFEPKVINNHYTHYGRGYNQAISDVYSKIVKTFKVRGLQE